MPLQTDFNVNPIWDDFDPSKGYYRILFRPSIPVQARELTQIQSLIQNQIESFGDWAFNNGDIVSGCSISDIESLPYIRINDFASNTTSNTLSLIANTLVNTYVTSATSNLSARVLLANNGLIANYPATNILYLQYLNTGISGQTSFGNNELLQFTSVSANSGNVSICNVYSIANTGNNVASGNARGVSVTSGVIFIDGVFVAVENNTYGIVNSYSTVSGNSVVGFQLNENIITEDQDASLHDNSLGYPNENAPGAWRLQLQPYLSAIDPNSVIANTFNPIAVYNSNSLILKTSSSNTLQSQIGEAVATTVYDEAGNYVITPFSVDTISKPSNTQYMQARVQPGIGYAQGYKINLLKTAYVDVRRGTDKGFLQEQQITVNYGNFVSLTQVAGNFDFDKYQTVQLYDTAQNAISNHLWASITPIGNVIGTAQVREFEYASGIPGSPNGVYNLYLFNIVMNSGKSFSSVNSVYYSNSGITGIGDVVTSSVQSTNPLLFGFGTSALFTLRDNNNNNNAEFTYRKKATGLQLSGNGQITISIASSAAGGVDSLPYGIGQVPDSRVFNDIIVIPQANISMSITNSNVNISNTNVIVNGNGTSFLNDVSEGENIKINSDVRNVISISNNTYLTVDSPFSTTANNQTYTKWYQTGSYVPLGSTYVNNRGVKVINSSSMVISTGINPNSSSFATVYYDILRTNVSPVTKNINKNVFVKIDTTKNPNGPWCLGFSDVHQLDAVYATSSNTSYGVNGINLTNNFLLDTGQKDDRYGLAYLYPNGNINLSGNPYLTVQIDYFSSNSSTGIGFYDIDSYPIDDINTSNTNAITTINLPIYVTSAGSQIPLRDVIDFRHHTLATANNTGVVDMSNATSIATAVSYATTNPSSNSTLYVSATGTYTPSVGSNFQSDLQYYIPRKDMFYFSPTGNLKIKEGTPSNSPQSPLSPENCMPVAILNIPAYPTLTTDQLDLVTNINQSSLTLTRQCNDPVLVTLITNRRYTMQDIGVLDTRITNLEQLLSLTLLESSASQLTITNSQGENAFKNGIFADPFNSHALGDVSNPEYRIAIDTENAVARPFINRTRVPIVYNQANSSTVKVGRAITLPYTEVLLISQPYSTEYMSAAPAAFHWNGTCMLYPSYTNNENVVNTGSVKVTINNATAWQQFAASPFGTIYGDWNTTTKVDKSSVTTGTINNTVNTVQQNKNVTVVLNTGSGGIGQTIFNSEAYNTSYVRQAAAAQGINLPANFTIGNATYKN